MITAKELILNDTDVSVKKMKCCVYLCPKFNRNKVIRVIFFHPYAEFVKLIVEDRL